MPIGGSQKTFATNQTNLEKVNNENAIAICLNKLDFAMEGNNFFI
jgi:hypothetical protein